MDTEQIMEIAEDYADAAADHAHECSTPNELTLLLNRRAALQVAIEALVQERDALKADHGEGKEYYEAYIESCNASFAVMMAERDDLRKLLTNSVNYCNALEESRNTYQHEADKLAAENKVLRDAWNAEPVAWIKYGNGITNLTTNAGIAERDKYDTPLYTRKQS